MIPFKYNFYQPVPDPEFGWRLHFADLAVNKVLAAASRRQPRDLVDLYLVHTSAAPGGTWPSGPDIDHFVIAHMIDSYGRNGENLWTAEPTWPAATS